MPANIVIILIAALSAAFLYHRTEPPLPRWRAVLLASLRTVVLAIALMLLINPILRFIRSKTESQQIIMLHDSSLSMNNDGKLQWMKRQAKTLEGKYRQAGYEVLNYSFANGLDGDPEDTQLAPALRDLAAKQDLSKASALLLFSDGWLRDENLGPVKQLGLPIMPVADSSQVIQPDLAVVSLRNNRHSYRGEPTMFVAELQSGDYSGPVMVRLMTGDRVLASKNLSLKASELTRVEFTHSFPSVGFYPLRVEVSAPELREKVLGNNYFPGAVDILADKERILMISDKAGWDNKFITDVITANSRWQSRSYTLQGGVIKLGEKVLSDFDRDPKAAIVVINNGELKADPRLVDLIKKAHRSGTGILWQGMPLKELTDVLALGPSNVAASFQGFFKLLPSSSAYPLLEIDSGELANIPPLDYYFLSPLAGAQVLAAIDTAQEPPAIAVKSIPGRVINLAFLNLWRWQLQSPGSTYRQTITNLLTWLSNQGGSTYQAIHANSYFQSEQINIRLRADDDIRQSRLDLNPRLKIMDADGKEVWSDFMARAEEDYVASLSLDKVGEYGFEISENGEAGKVKGRFHVAAGSLEERDHHYNLPLLSWLASESGGRLLNQTEISSLSPPLPQTRKLTITNELPLYRKWYVLGLFILAFCVELFLRRRWGLL
ncbi:MAG TPA: hypothetical protein PKX36_08020 [Candidatus Cloacimonadota bacterium]|nr:hypothetical protein [Candidatus Cloacimonadota bacterium]